MRSKETKYRAHYWRRWKDANRPDIIKKCIICSKNFKPELTDSNAAKRCPACRYIICEHCGEKFKPKDATYYRKYCSPQCRYGSKKGKEPEHLRRNRGRKPRTYHLRKRDKHGNAFDVEWRKAVFERDNYTCQNCRQKGGRLHAHHIKPFKKYPELRYDLNNGITLCIECHKKTDSYGWSNYWQNHLSQQRLAQGVLI